MYLLTNLIVIANLFYKVFMNIPPYAYIVRIIVGIQKSISVNCSCLCTKKVSKKYLFLYKYLHFPI